MKYLLSNGLSTSNKETYIKDLIDVNFSIYPRDLPFNSDFGVERRIHALSSLEFMDGLRTSIESLLVRINNRHKTSLTLLKMEQTSSTVKVEINMGLDEIIDYDINFN